ncbi:ABC transporter substrate-binding protein [Micromonospora zhanjiangensis]|uniref:ABC transporter substrate-binding protein n=1 Tax=Micromonospora zhanjiangensis TaxID=1522057 RepID=A0ABV8KW18_9ACTN
MTVIRRRALLAGVALSASLVITGCGSGSDNASGDTSGPVSEADVQAALDAGGNLTVWAWEPTLKKVVEGFQAKYPKVKVNLVNAGTNKDQYTALQNAIKAGSGVPDVAQVEYYALPQFALAKSLADLKPYGADKLDGTFTPGPWNGVKSGGVTYGLPMDSGPMALFYNKDVFDKHGIAVPATWDAYVAAAEKLHKADPKVYLTSDNGDPGQTTSMIWQAGGKPYTVDGTTVGVNFADPGAQKYATTWQKLIDGKLLSPVNGWTDEWFKGLADGTIASLTTGAWMPANLESGAAAGSGKWRVAPMPQWEAGGKATAENGGSSLAIMNAAANKKLAWAFMKYATVDEGAQTRVDAGAFPAKAAQLEAPAFKNKEFPYFGGQKVNEVLAASAGQVVPGWSYLPFQVYANSVFGDTAGKAYLGNGSLSDGLKAWQEASVKYGKEQGFTVK